MMNILQGYAAVLRDVKIF